MVTSSLKEKISIWLAWKLPKRLVYWAAIRLLCHGTQGKYSYQVVPELTGLEALQRWHKDYGTD